MTFYFQLLLLPWGYDNIRTDDYEDLVNSTYSYSKITKISILKQ